MPRSKYLFVVATAILVLGILQATHVFQLPIASWLSALSGSLFSGPSLRDFMSKYGYLSLFGLMTLESASLPVPSEVVLPLAGYFVQQGAMNFWAAVLVSTAAALFGALADYFLAKWLGRPFVVRLLGVFRIHKGALDRAEGWFQRSGQWTVFAARFVPGLRTIISLPAGLFEMKLRPFVILTLAGCFAWDAVLVYAGVLAGNDWNGAFKSSATTDALAAVLAFVSAAYIIYYAYPRLFARSV
ncbi:MAG: DedA family protein [Thaumarchaeota archaeon]|nr:DedA family protein [Nitrososphaerota archaeon]